MVTLIPIDDIKTKLSFLKSLSAADIAEIQQIIMSKTGISAHIDKSTKSSGDGKDVKRRKNETFIVIRCLESQLEDLLDCAPELVVKYPSFEMAEEIFSEKFKLPRGTTRIKVLFSDPISKWRRGRVSRLIKYIADISGLNRKHLRLVKVERSSTITELRLPKSAAQKLLLKKSRQRYLLKAKFPTLVAIELIADSEPLPQSVSIAHAVPTDSRCLLD